MKLNQLLKGILFKQITGNEETEISCIHTDSRSVKPGSLFICLSGFKADGHQFAQQAIQNGASAVMVEKPLPGVPDGVTVITVPETKRVLPIVASTFYDHPSCKLRMIGITGTNGKTTTSHMVEHILNKSGCSTGLIGTLYMKHGELQVPTVNTTPDPIKLQGFLRLIADRGGRCAVLEVSSHGLDMGRVTGCGFHTAVFTNLSHDHLDFHHHMDDYRQSKEILFSRLGNSADDMLKTAILNGDDESSSYYANRTSAQVLSYGLNSGNHIRGLDVRCSGSHQQFLIKTYDGEHHSVTLRMPGIHNVYNALAAAAVCFCEGMSWEDIVSGLETFEGIPGRFEDISSASSFQVTVDYAHNPGGLRAALITARDVTKGKVICVMGCRGERDKLKRPIMAGIAADLADHVIFTSDNSYAEDIENIFNDMKQGLERAKMDHIQFIKDRKEAIQQAVSSAAAGDRVVITGRGHEKELVTGSAVQKASDADLVKECMHCNT
ncbi:UDP-N-acetylmuramoyl-L-alanyl-D-glutamate--2,6-diaminopimelate ligase [Paenibacillus lemnae]|uniref:UDP-N-acetylmuramyl-tripeptide synthetase n=1 Tax=Paenibacillus lemnae TaxID=1330551 RepID=A0A848M9U2_PAELE|nr:UDP-N-acetylmuramoyl-L-alanyl-D-glutamate--2,6-diaminopimelate ligase [Paenibacillus lemnae]NMO97817.1 UDP-N-acetylmuramoyl-L-alanyl-D-glutamate--2,6-diaminopimelate ligase [Paenibacillus lemnae]